MGVGADFGAGETPAFGWLVRTTQIFLEKR